MKRNEYQFQDAGDGLCRLRIDAPPFVPKPRIPRKRIVISSAIFALAMSASFGAFLVRQGDAAVSVAFSAEVPGIYAKYSPDESKRKGLPISPLFAVGNIGKTNAVASTHFTSSDYSYTGSSTFIDDGDGHCRIKFLTSGTFTPTKTFVFDVFLVGGGGGGWTPAGANGGGGAGGGYTHTHTAITLNAGTGYTITVGAGGTTNNSGGQSSAFGYSANGGLGGSGTYQYGQNGGSGGGACGYTSGSKSGQPGGSDGSNGYSNDVIWGGTGQGTTTREFGEAGATLYGGGGGGGAYYSTGSGGAGGAGGGGAGGAYNAAGSNGTTNTGGGGGGGGSASDSPGGTGGRGIVIIRDHR